VGNYIRVVCDMDEVLAQFVAKVLRRWNAINGTNFTRDDVNCWRMEEVLGVDTLGRSAEGLIDEWLGEDGFFEDLEPVGGAIDGFNALRRSGHDVVIATSIPGVAVHSFTGKRRWLKRHFPDFSLKNFVAISRKGLLEGDVLIDDATHNINDWIEAGRDVALVFDAPWNRNINENLSPRRGETFILRVRNWDEVLGFLGGWSEARDVRSKMNA